MTHKSWKLHDTSGITEWGHRESDTKNSPFLHTGQSVQSLNHVWLFETPWTAACQASLSVTNAPSLLKLMSIESAMASIHLILCRSFLLLPSIFPSIRVFSNESVLCIRWPKYWSFNFSISPSNEYSGLISFKIDWFGPIHGYWCWIPYWRQSFGWSRTKNSFIALPGFPGSSASKESICSRTPWFDSWVRNILWSRDRVPTPVFLWFPGKESACNVGGMGSISGLGRSPSGGHGTHCTVLAWRIPMDRGASRTRVHGVAKSQTQLSD